MSKISPKLCARWSSLLCPMLNSCHKHVHRAPVSCSNQRQLVQVLSHFPLMHSWDQVFHMASSHSFPRLLGLTEILAVVHGRDSLSEMDTRPNLSTGRFLVITVLHIALRAKKLNQSLLSRYCNIIGTALEKTRKKRTVCLYC